MGPVPQRANASSAFLLICCCGALSTSAYLMHISYYGMKQVHTHLAMGYVECMNNNHLPIFRVSLERKSSIDQCAIASVDPSCCYVAKFFQVVDIEPWRETNATLPTSPASKRNEVCFTDTHRLPPCPTVSSLDSYISIMFHAPILNYSLPSDSLI